MRTRFLLIFLVLQSVAQAYVCQGLVLRKKMPTGDRYRYVIALGDFHDLIVPEDNEHRKIVISWLKNGVNRNIRVLTEDLNSPNDLGRFAHKGFFLEKPEGAFLGNITDACRAAGASAVNLEYRYARLLTFGPILNGISAAQSTSCTKIVMRDLIQEVEYELERIAAYNDGPILTDWYKQSSEHIRAAMRAFSWPAFAHAPVADYLAAVSGDLKRVLRERLIPFDVDILDMKIVHDIVSSDADRTCIIAGASHIDRVENRLVHVGFEPVSRLDACWPTDFNASSIDYAPYPIDPAVLESFLLNATL